MFLAFLTLAIILSFTYVFFSVGLVFLNKFKINHFFSSFLLTTSVSFFIGALLFLFFWRIISLFTNDAKFALFVSTVFCLLLILKERKSLYHFLKNNFKKLLYLTIFLSFFIGIYIAYSLIPMPDLFLSHISQTNPGYGFHAVAHSLRAGNIAIYIFQNNFIPLFTQNYGQSLLAAIPMFFGLNVPQLSLIVWLAVNIFFLSLFIYGLIYYVVGNKIYSWFGAIVSVFGNTALSLSYVETVDTGSTNLLITNVDTIIGIVTFIIFIFCCFLFLKHCEKNNEKFLLFFIFVCGFVWNIIAAHNIPLALVCLLVLFFYSKEKNIHLRLQRIFIVLFLFFIGVISGIFVSGGMLMPYRFADHVNIPGLMSVYSPGSKFSVIELRPKMFLMNYDTAAQSKNVLKNIVARAVGISQPMDDSPRLVEVNNSRVISSDNSKNIMQTFLLLFKNQGPLRFLVYFIIIFFPTLGLLLSFYLNKKINTEENVNNYFDNVDMELVKIIWLIGSALFVLGSFFSAFVVLFGREIETSRFLGVGNFIAMFFLGLSVALIYKHKIIFNRFSLILFSIIFVFCVTGPILQFGLVRLVGNFVLPDKTDSQIFSLPPNLYGRTLTISERFQAMLNINSIAGEFYVDNHSN